MIVPLPIRILQTPRTETLPTAGPLHVLVRARACTACGACGATGGEHTLAGLRVIGGSPRA